MGGWKRCPGGHRCDRFSPAESDHQRSRHAIAGGVAELVALPFRPDAETFGQFHLETGANILHGVRTMPSCQLVFYAIELLATFDHEFR